MKRGNETQLARMSKIFTPHFVHLAVDKNGCAVARDLFKYCYLAAHGPEEAVDSITAVIAGSAAHVASSQFGGPIFATIYSAANPEQQKKLFAEATGIPEDKTLADVLDEADDRDKALLKFRRKASKMITERHLFLVNFPALFTATVVAEAKSADFSTFLLDNILARAKPADIMTHKEAGHLLCTLAIHADPAAAKALLASVKETAPAIAGDAKTQPLLMALASRSAQFAADVAEAIVANGVAAVLASPTGPRMLGLLVEGADTVEAMTWPTPAQKEAITGPVVAIESIATAVFEYFAANPEKLDITTGNLLCSALASAGSDAVCKLAEKWVETSQHTEHKQHRTMQRLCKRECSNATVFAGAVVGAINAENAEFFLSRRGAFVLAAAAKQVPKSAVGIVDTYQKEVAEDAGAQALQAALKEEREKIQKQPKTPGRKRRAKVETPLTPSRRSTRVRTPVRHNPDEGYN
ncbi:hypothetical protein J8273_4394 [Carpediemonas membranifera]|nr:hypothetical protein J8273_4394 [Carpediemonas membranifera]|eukprot:KAG9394031.1 hypothetical protein J8273_4394 [Carpediemonas membranifera]